MKTEMKHSQIVRLYALIVTIILGGIVITAPITVGLSTLWPHATLYIKSWKELLMGLALILALIAVTQAKLWPVIYRDMIIRVVAAYSALHLLLLGYHFQGGGAAGAGILIDLRYLLFFVLCYTLMLLAPWYRLRLLIVSAIGAMVVVVFGALQLFLPRDILSHIGYGPKTIEPYLTVDKNPKFVRINSTLRGPNPLGAYVTIVLASMAAILARQPGRLKNQQRLIGFIVVASAAVITLWISYSRSALIAAVIALVLVGVLTSSKLLIQHKWIVLGLAVFLVALNALVLVAHPTIVSNVILHDNPTTGSHITSDQAHASSLRNGVKTMIHHPLGSGIGSTGSASLLSTNSTIVEDQYLFVAHETGWLGLGIFLLLSYLVLRRLFMRRSDWLSLGLFASGMGLLCIGILLPVWADDTVSIVWWGLAGIALGSPILKISKKKRPPTHA